MYTNIHNIYMCMDMKKGNFVTESFETSDIGTVEKPFMSFYG